MFQNLTKIVESTFLAFDHLVQNHLAQKVHCLMTNIKIYKRPLQPHCQIHQMDSPRCLCVNIHLYWQIQGQ